MYLKLSICYIDHYKEYILSLFLLHENRVCVLCVHTAGRDLHCGT